MIKANETYFYNSNASYQRQTKTNFRTLDYGEKHFYCAWLFCVHALENRLLENSQESETNELQNFLKKFRDANHQEKMERARWYWLSAVLPRPQEHP